MRLASTRIVTADAGALGRFYAAITGIAPLGVDDYLELPTTTGVLAISSQRSVALFNAGAAVAGANRSVIVEFEVADVDQARRRLGALVCEFVMEPTDQPWGCRSMLFRDPDGNLVSFFTPGVRAGCRRRPRWDLG